MSTEDQKEYVSVAKLTNVNEALRKQLAAAEKKLLRYKVNETANLCCDKARKAFSHLNDERGFSLLDIHQKRIHLALQEAGIEEVHAAEAADFYGEPNNQIFPFWEEFVLVKIKKANGI